MSLFPRIFAILSEKVEDINSMCDKRYAIYNSNPILGSDPLEYHVFPATPTLHDWFRKYKYEYKKEEQYNITNLPQIGRAVCRVSYMDAFDTHFWKTGEYIKYPTVNDFIPIIDLTIHKLRDPPLYSIAGDTDDKCKLRILQQQGLRFKVISELNRRLDRTFASAYDTSSFPPPSAPPLPSPSGPLPPRATPSSTLSPLKPPLFVVEALVKDLLQKDTQCPISLSPLKEAGEVSVAPCFHSFSSDSITSWLCTKATCPVCKKGLTKDALTQIKIEAAGGDNSSTTHPEVTPSDPTDPV